MGKDFAGTKPVYQHEGQLYTLTTTIHSVQPLATLPADEQSLFKGDASSSPPVQVVVANETIFYPQGGGQPSDVGNIKSVDDSVVFKILISRNVPGKRVLHFGIFEPESGSLKAGQEVKMEIDAKKRILYSRIHTAGHILGLAVGRLSSLIPDVVDAKAQHYPDAAYVEFKGHVDAKHKDAIQAETDKLVEQRLPVQLHWWDMDELQQKCASVLEGFSMPDGEKARAVEIVGAGAYPCGGTHVLDSSGVGKIVVGKIKRTKGMSRVSYSVVPNE